MGGRESRSSERLMTGIFDFRLAICNFVACFEKMCVACLEDTRNSLDHCSDFWRLAFPPEGAVVGGRGNGGVLKDRRQE